MVSASEITTAALQKEESRLQALKDVVSRCRQQLTEAEDEYDTAKTNFEWKQLLHRLDVNPQCKAAQSQLATAISAYEKCVSMLGQTDNDTDEYDDFSNVDAVVDKLTQDWSTAWQTGNYETALLLLLLTSVRIGRLVEILQSKSSSLGERPSSLGDAEECRDTLVEEWKKLLGASSDHSEVLPNEEAEDVEEDSVEEEILAAPSDLLASWRKIVQTHLGAPFDSGL